MNINWTAAGIGFAVALILYIIGAFTGSFGILKSVIYTLAPIIGGFMAAYINKGDYVDSIMNGGFAGGIAGFIATFMILALFGSADVLMGNLGLVIIVTIIRAITAGAIGAVLGLIGGIVGILIKGQGFEKENADR